MTAPRSLSASLQNLGRMMLAGDVADLPDTELVGRFVQQRDEAAFTALVRRYGGIVFGVCRRVLRHEQDAEDAFQATFLVFARKAASVQRTGAVGNWLYGVACNVARKAKALRHRREVKEREAAARQRPDTSAAVRDDWQEILNVELLELPDKYRTPIILCDLMGLTIREAAGQVGCPSKTLGTRLSRGRSLLAGRLTRRGLAISAAAMSAVVGPKAVAAVPAQVIGSTVHAAIGFAAGSAAVVSPAVAALTHGVSNLMLKKSLKSGVVLACVVLAVAGLSVGHLSGLPGGSNQHAVVASEAGDDLAAQPAAKDSSAAPKNAKQPSFLDQLHLFLVRLLHPGAIRPSVDEVSDDPKDDQDKPALSGVWVLKGGEVKIDFSGKEVMKIFPHGDNEVIIILCQYTLDKEGLVKAKITGLEGKDEVKDKAKEKLPIGLEFSFKWKVKDAGATLDDFKADKGDILKSHLEGDYEQKK